MMDIPRRCFLKSCGWALVSFAVTPSLLQRTALAQTLRGTGKERPIVVAIFQRGAADGLSMVVPFGDPFDYNARPQIAIAEPKRRDPEAAIDLDGFFALHPALAPVEAYL